MLALLHPWSSPGLPKPPESELADYAALDYHEHTSRLGGVCLAAVLILVGRPPSVKLPYVAISETYFFLEEGTVRAVDGVTLTIPRGKTLGVVGESGCGKSVMARSILRIVQPPGRIVEGQIIYHRRSRDNGSSRQEELVNLTALDQRGSEIRAVRGNEIAMVFQEPMTAFSPVHTIGNQLPRFSPKGRGFDPRRVAGRGQLARLAPADGLGSA